MEERDAPVDVRSIEGMNCARCDKRAAFLSPVGPLCPTDALLAAAFHDWIPEQIRPEDHEWVLAEDR